MIVRSVVLMGLIRILSAAWHLCPYAAWRPAGAALAGAAEPSRLWFFTPLGVLPGAAGARDTRHPVSRRLASCRARLWAGAGVPLVIDSFSSFGRFVTVVPSAACSYAIDSKVCNVSSITAMKRAAA